MLGCCWQLRSWAWGIFLAGCSPVATLGIACLPVSKRDACLRLIQMLHECCGLDQATGRVLCQYVRITEEEAAERWPSSLLKTGDKPCTYPSRPLNPCGHKLWDAVINKRHPDLLHGTTASGRVWGHARTIPVIFPKPPRAQWRKSVMLMATSPSLGFFLFLFFVMAINEACRCGFPSGIQHRSFMKLGSLGMGGPEVLSAVIFI